VLAGPKEVPAGEESVMLDISSLEPGEYDMVIVVGDEEASAAPASLLVRRLVIASDEG
jgi:hypothetical protein